MNLGKMLAAGKSFISGRAPTAYRENKHVYLPKFNAEKNPFMPNAPEPTGVAPVSSKHAAMVAAKTQKISTLKPATAPVRPPARAKNWTAKLNPFRPSPPPAPLALPTVQTELSLDSVKVVHNDLTDADVEVVPARSQTNKQPETPMLAPACESWEFLGERLVKSV
jgi:hypothetical protein